MAILSALLSYLARQASSLLRVVFGWSITGLFGRLPNDKQTALSAAMLLSLLWPLLVLGIFAPGVAAWAFAIVPIHRLLSPGVTRIIWFVSSVALPPVVGGLTRWVSHGQKAKGGGLRGVLGGYPITFG